MSEKAQRCRRAAAIPPAFTVCLLVLQTAALARPGGPGPDTVRLDTAEISIGLFFHGRQVALTAMVPDGDGAAAVCEGPLQDLDLMRKGRVLGVWMNVGEVKLRSVPSLYLVRATAPLEELADDPTLARLGLGLRALASTVRAGDGSDADRLFPSLVALKRSERLYSVVEGKGFTDEPTSGGNRRIRFVFPIPARALNGQYTVTAYAFHKGTPILLGTTSLRVTKGRIPAALFGLAHAHGLLYGLLAVLAATIVGLLIGVLLSSRRSH